MSFVIVKLEDFIFDNAEVPQVVNGGGDQMLAVHQLIGGKRVVDAMGKSSDEINFRGLFQGVTSLDRVRYVDGLKNAGKPVIFSYLDYRYRVVIKHFSWAYRAVYKISYQITLTVVEDLTRPVNYIIPVPFSDAIFEAYQEALDIALLTENPSILSSMALLGEAINAAQNLNELTTSQITQLTGLVSNTVSNVDNAINTLTT
jgi:hypothetical protein